MNLPNMVVKFLLTEEFRNNLGKEYLVTRFERTKPIPETQKIYIQRTVIPKQLREDSHGRETSSCYRRKVTHYVKRRVGGKRRSRVRWTKSRNGSHLKLACHIEIQQWSNINRSRSGRNFDIAFASQRQLTWVTSKKSYKWTRYTENNRRNFSLSNVMQIRLEMIMNYSLFFGRHLSF